jgi:hypothetical protein
LCHWVSVEVVYEKTVVVSEELTAEDGLVIACDIWVQIRNKNIAAQ